VFPPFDANTRIRADHVKQESSFRRATKPDCTQNHSDRYGYDEVNFVEISLCQETISTRNSLCSFKLPRNPLRIHLQHCQDFENYEAIPTQEWLLNELGIFVPTVSVRVTKIFLIFKIRRHYRRQSNKVRNGRTQIQEIPSASILWASSNPSSSAYIKGHKWT